MIDKADGRIPCDTPFDPRFSELYRVLRSDPKKDPFHPTKHYTAVGDLREYGYDVILHLGCKHGKYGNHKLELLDTGNRPYSHLVTEIERIFQIDGQRVELMRLDLAVDVPSVPVTWFQSRVKANYKQFIANFGSAEFVEMGKGGIQTLNFGKRPNMFRIYDKISEYKHQYQLLKRRLPPGTEPPDFESLYGYPPEGIVRTRVERQMGSSGLPPGIVTFGDLAKLESYAPFETLKLIVGTGVTPDPGEFSFMEFCTGMYLREMTERVGMHATMKFITSHSKRNTGWAIKKFSRFMPGEHETQMLNQSYLDEAFRLSVTKQLSA